MAALLSVGVSVVYLLGRKRVVEFKVTQVVRQRQRKKEKERIKRVRVLN